MTISWICNEQDFDLNLLSHLQAIFARILDAEYLTWTCSFTEIAYKIAELMSLAERAGIDVG